MTHNINNNYKNLNNKPWNVNQNCCSDTGHDIGQGSVRTVLDLIISTLLHLFQVICFCMMIIYFFITPYYLMKT